MNVSISRSLWGYFAIICTVDIHKGVVIEEVKDEAREEETHEVKPANDGGKTVVKPDGDETNEEEDKEESGNFAQINSGNGADLEKYRWVQTLGDVEIRIPIMVSLR